MEGYSNHTTVEIESNSERTYQLTWEMLPQKFKEIYIDYHQGDTVLNYEAQVGLTLFYVVLILLGLPGNLMTCIIIWCNSNIITPTNCFLLNLAIVDIITLITGKWCANLTKNVTFFFIKNYYYYYLILNFFEISALPLEVYLIWNPVPWIFGLLGCQIMSMFTEIVVYVSIFTMIAFTFERYIVQA